MVLVAKVNKGNISEVKEKLRDNDNLNNEYRITTDDTFGYLPLNKKREEEINKDNKNLNKNVRRLIIEIKDKRLTKIKKKESYKSKLKKLLGKNEFSSFDVIGDICIVRIDFELKNKEKEIGQILLSIPNVKTVLKRESKYGGEYRTQKLKFLAGIRKKETTHIESGIRLKLDVEKVYFSIRSSRERLRIANLVKKREKVLVMFSGCSPYELVIGKHSKAKLIVGIEKNPIANKYAFENMKLNKMNEKSERIKLFNGDVKEVCSSLKKEKFDRIIMPLPRKAYEYLWDALKVSKKGTKIHLYMFEKWDDEKSMKKEWQKTLDKYFGNLKIKNIVKAGNYSPNVYRVCFDLEVTDYKSGEAFEGTVTLISNN